MNVKLPYIFIQLIEYYLCNYIKQILQRCPSITTHGSSLLESPHMTLNPTLCKNPRV